MKLKEEINNILKEYSLTTTSMGLIESLPISLKLAIVGKIITILSDGRCNNPIYNGFSYRLPFLHLISLYNQATDMHKNSSYLPFIRYASNFAERILKAHVKGENNE